MMPIQIPIRSVQHYLYCPHRWGLLEIDQAWAENLFVSKANLLHKRVHEPNNHYATKAKKVFTSVPVYCDDAAYCLYGMVDCLEATKTASGINLHGLEGRYRLCIVEYKPTQPKNKTYNEDDLMQVFAQKICVDYTFGGDCDGVLYYADVRKRIPLPLREHFAEYDQRLKSVLQEMRINLANGSIPPIAKKQKCNGCSMKDLCMPSPQRRQGFRQLLQKIQENTP